MKVTITKDHLSEATAKGIITKSQEEGLWQLFITDSSVDSPSNNTLTSESPFVKMLYYSGTVMIIGAMGWFMNRAWDSWSGAGVATIALLYALGFILTGRIFSNKSSVLSNLFYVAAVAMTPLFTYGLQKSLGFWPGEYPGTYRNFHSYIKGGWMFMELSTLLLGTVALRYIKIPIAMAIPAFTLWYMSMDVTPLLWGTDNNWHLRKYVSIAFGAIMILVAFIIDNRKNIDYGKWLYIFGGIAFWGGLSSLNSSNEWSKLIYFIINISMMCIGTLLERRVFMIFGSLGCIGYIGHLAYSLFENSSLFPIILVAFGLFVIFCGWFLHENRVMIRTKIFSLTPQLIIDLLPENRK